MIQRSKTLANPHPYRIKTKIVSAQNNSPTIARWKLIIYSLIGIIAYSTDIVVTPIYIDSFKKDNHKSNPYYVSVSSNLFFAIIFTVITLSQNKCNIKEFVGSFKMQKHLFINSIFYCIFNLLMLESSPENRTPVDLQAILNQSYVPFVFVCSWLMKKEKLNRFQLYGAIVVFIGILVSLIPIIKNLAINSNMHNKYILLWTFLFLLSMFVCGIANVGTDIILKKYKGSIQIMQSLAWLHTYQFLIILSFFWINIAAKEYKGTKEWDNEVTKWSIVLNCFFQHL